MQPSDFSYQLPEKLIALHPAPSRSQSRLLCLDAGSGETEHRRFAELIEYLVPGDLLVFNDTRVIPARLFGSKQSGGRVEVLIERLLDGNRVLAQVRAGKSPKPGTQLLFDLNQPQQPTGSAGLSAEVLGREQDFFLLQFPVQQDLSKALAHYGHIPLPPYIRRDDGPDDRERYQTVYAAREGAVAAPTAGLHFDQELLDRIAQQGIGQAFLTLHVGAGTFQPVRVDDIREHHMHKELIDVSQTVCDQVNDCKQRGGRVIAVGTTTVRSLESAARDGALQPFHGDTDIFIYPGFEFQIVDAMVTNFHLPESTLLMLVSAFADKKMLLDAYHEAIEHGYRFFSYGDAMFIYRA